MSLPWFRMYHRAIDDERLRLLAFEDRWHYVAILCLKCEGMIDDEQDELWFRRLAVKLGVQTRELEEIQRRLMNVGLVDAHWQPLKWSELQYKSDSSNERVKAYRKRQKKQSAARVKRKRNVTVTAQETDTDTELSTNVDCAKADASALKPEHVVEKWNEIAQAMGKPRVRDLTPTRRQLIKARIAQYQLEDFVGVFDRIQRSAFLRGDKGWTGCTFDWSMKRANFQKILEGNYDD